MALLFCVVGAVENYGKNVEYSAVFCAKTCGKPHAGVTKRNATLQRAV